MQTPVLVLDANQRCALAAIRSLGRRGIHVIAADETRRTLGGCSRYCRDTFVYPSPYRSSGAFLDALRTETTDIPCGVVLPMSEVTTSLLIRHRDEFPNVTLPFASREAFDTLNDKWRLHQLAKSLGIPVPSSHLVDPRTALNGLARSLHFPVVVKPALSRTPQGTSWLDGSVHYVNSPTELQHLRESDPLLRNHPFLIQERIVGHGQGLFALYNRGKPVTFFAHRRLREKPPSGGVSVLCESIPLNSKIQELVQRLLDHVHWHGVAMAEFKVTSDGHPYLLEVNPRFWGSLQLAIDSGVDFPWLLYNLSLGNDVAPVPRYKTYRRCRWLVGDLDNLYLTWKSHSPLIEKIRSFLRFLIPSRSRTRHEVNRFEDFKPFLFELYTYCKGTQL